MAHAHKVVDADPVYRIDPVSRQIIPGEGSTKTHIMQFDHNSERLGFVLPRYIDGHDMSTCNRVEVHYTNTGENKLGMLGVYPVDDLAVSPDNEEEVVCTWLISQNATSLAGELSFSLEYICETDGIIDYRLGTEEYTGLAIHGRRNHGEAVIKQIPDVLEQWKGEIIDKLKENLPTEIGGIPPASEFDEGCVMVIAGGEWIGVPTTELYSDVLCCGGGYLIDALNEHHGRLDAHDEQFERIANGETPEIILP